MGHFPYYTMERHCVFQLLRQGHDQSSTLSQHTAELTLPKHNPLHRDLLRYAKLMEWLKNTQREKYDGLSRVSARSKEEHRSCVL